jgi:hypothetical protein
LIEDFLETIFVAHHERRAACLIGKSSQRTDIATAKAAPAPSREQTAADTI